MSIHKKIEYQKRIMSLVFAVVLILQTFIFTSVVTISSNINKDIKDIKSVQEQLCVSNEKSTLVASVNPLVFIKEEAVENNELDKLKPLVTKIENSLYESLLYPIASVFLSLLTILIAIFFSIITRFQFKKLCCKK